MNNVIQVSAAQWAMMLVLKDNIRAMKTRNEDGKCDICIRKEKSFLRDMFREITKTA